MNGGFQPNEASLGDQALHCTLKLKISRLRPAIGLVHTRPLFERLFSLNGKAALITGASGGIGRVLAVAFAEAGARVGVHGTNRAKIETACHAIEEKGGRAIALAFELDDPVRCEKLISEAAAALDGIDILVNCAGTNRRKPIRSVTQNDFDTILNVNLRSVFFLCQAAYPILRRQGGGKIINVGSVTSTAGLGGVSV